ncbi:MAG TPA: hypothetical protein VMF08_06185 [Candidatus Sulfotelmatobacter sp.]|nr:hypothetical protein [Candidatus Sulfotelmatobacter sp.]
MQKVPLSRDRAWACVMLNVSVPGWGTIKAGRKATGICEIIFALGGFFLLLAWMGLWMVRVMQSAMGEDLSPIPSPWIWRSGVICIVISWIWTGITCYHLMRDAKAYEKSLPPRLSDLPKPPVL